MQWGQQIHQCRGRINSSKHRVSFANMTKEEIKAKLEEEKNSSGFEWD